MVWRCSVCWLFVAVSLKLLLTHIHTEHSHQPRFQVRCLINGCPAVCRRYNSFFRHVQREHPEQYAQRENIDQQQLELLQLPEPTNRNNDNTDQGHNFYEGTEAVEDNVDMADDHVHAMDEETDPPLKKRRLGLLAYTMTLRHHHQVQEGTINFITEQTNRIVKEELQTVKREIFRKLRMNGDAEPISNVFDTMDLPFDGMLTAHERKCHIQSLFEVIQPEVICIKRTPCTRRHAGNQILGIKELSFSYVPLKESIRQFLKNDDIADLVFQSRSAKNGFYCDFTDGFICKHHVLLADDPDALRLLLFADDFEICNPLAKSAGLHKICAFYYTIANLPLQYRSRLPAIRILALIKRKDMQINKVLERIRDDLQELAEGITLTLKGKEKFVKAVAIAFLGDTLGAHEICGLKLGVGFSNKKCRECHCTNDYMQRYFHESHFQSRTLESHIAQCEEIERAQTQNERNRLSTEHGINFRSAATNFPYFDITSMVPEDVMHVIYEGVFPYETKACLMALANENCITLKKLNDAIQNLPYGYKDRETRPSLLQDNTFERNDYSLHQSASSMITLSKFLPFILVEKLHCNPDRDIIKFLLELCEMLKVLIAPIIAQQTVENLRNIIEKHLKAFKQLFPRKNIIPKQHYLIHLPSTIKRYGPPCRVWCMRFEGKHNFLKKQMRGSNNFKNVVKTVIEKTLSYEASLNISDRHPLFANDFSVGKTVPLPDPDMAKRKIDSFFGIGFRNINTVHAVKWVIYRGQKFVAESCVVAFGDNGCLPEFGLVSSIWLANIVDSTEHQIFFCLSMYETVQYDKKRLGYEIRDPDCAQGCEVVHVDNLLTYQPLHVYPGADDRLFVFAPHSLSDVIKYHRS